MTSDFIPHLPNLAADGSNWVTYRDRIKRTITIRGLSDHLTNDAITQNYVSAGDIGGLTPEQRWTADKIAVNQIFCATIPDLVFSEIKSTYEPKGIWEKLKDLSEEKSRRLLVGQWRKIQKMRVGEDDDVRAHLEKLAHLHESLSSFGRTISDAKYISVILRSLPPSYDPTVSSLTYSYEANDKALTPTAIIRMALHEQERRSLRKSIAAEERKNKRKNIECYNCRKEGHYRSECRAKGGGKEGQRPRRLRKDENPKNKGKDTSNSTKESTNTAAEETLEDGLWTVIVDADEASEENNSYDNFKLSALTDSATLSSAKPEVELYVSSASQHISPFPHRFTNLRSIPPRPITTANSRVFYAIGTGDIKIDVPNGMSSTPITLKNTLYAPDMGQTVVSISRIVAAGYSVAFEGKSCKIKNKSGDVIGDIPASPNGLYIAGGSCRGGASPHSHH